MRDTYTNLRLAVDRVRIEAEERLVRGEILLRAKRYPVYRYGDELEVEGKLQTPPSFEGFSDFRSREPRLSGCLTDAHYPYPRRRAG